MKQKRACPRKHYLENKDRYYNQSIEWAKKHPHRVWARSTFFGHKARGIEINMTVDELEELAKDTIECSICGAPIAFGYGLGFRPTSPTLDRTDNGGTITKDNITIMCRRCNVTKGDRDMKSFLEYCKMVCEKFCV